MELNEDAISLICSFEGFHEEGPDGLAVPYRCPAGIWTIGYGSTRTPSGDPVSEDTGPISRDEAKLWMHHDLAGFGADVHRLVKVPLNENQFGALVSFTYNVGSGNFKSSTLRQKLNRGDYIGASNEFWKWRRAGGVILSGLVRRRAAEKNLFLKRN